jgi:beta-lactamase regulating signal transducer with metallopeptidase domain
MGTFIVFIIKSAICLIVFYLFYKLLLSKDTFHRFNRIALLSILLLSFVVPFGVIGLRPASHTEQAISQENVVTQASSAEIVQTATPAPSVESSPVWLLVLIVTYLAGIVFCFSRQLWSMSMMFSLMHSSRKSKMGKDATLMVHTKQIAPFSWMKYIVISEKDLKEDGKEIITHELAHIQNKHSWDLLVADICIYFQWFNPAAWLLKQELQSIHEFEADERVLNQGIDAKQYQLLLIKKAVGTRLYSMANSFNHSSLKKRITMMLKEKSNPYARLKYVYILPLSCITMLAFAHPSVSSVEENTVEKVNDLLSLAPAEKAIPLISSADKISENSGIANTAKVKNSERPNTDDLLAVNDAHATKPVVKKNTVTATSTVSVKPGTNDLQAVNDAQTTKPVAQKDTTTAPSTVFVKGRVISSSDKRPLVMVKICEIDPSTGRIFNITITRIDGMFELKAKNSSNKLRFSYAGFKDTVCAIKESVNIQMDEATLPNKAAAVGATAESTDNKETNKTTPNGL